jgi:hypothetical protein
MSFVTLKGRGIVHIPGSLVGYEPQFIAVLNGAHHGCQSTRSGGLNFTWRLISNMGRESDGVHDKAKREND